MFQVMKKRCAECLFGANKIVLERRKEADDVPFLRKEDV